MRVYKFQSSDVDHPLCKIIGEIQRADFPTHSGLVHFPDADTLWHNEGFTLEARCNGVVERPWSEYSRDPSQRVIAWEWVGAKEADLTLAFEAIRSRFLGKPYPYGQLLLTGVWLWAKRHRFPFRMPATYANVCSELVWHMIDFAGGPQQIALLTDYPRKDEFLPLTDYRWSERRPDLWRRVQL